MAKNQTRRIRGLIFTQDKDAFAALQKINAYDPNNKDHTTANVQKALDSVDASQTAWAQAKADRNSARDDAVEAEWEFHNLMLAARGQVKTQFGVDSNEVQAVGRKKASDYNPPRRKNGNGDSKPHP